MQNTFIRLPQNSPSPVYQQHPLRKKFPNMFNNFSFLLLFLFLGSRQPACDSGGDTLAEAPLHNELFPGEPGRGRPVRGRVLRDAELDHLPDREVS